MWHELTEEPKVPVDQHLIRELLQFFGDHEGLYHTRGELNISRLGTGRFQIDLRSAKEGVGVQKIVFQAETAGVFVTGFNISELENETVVEKLAGHLGETISQWIAAFLSC